MAAECPVKTGTRTHVVVTARSGRPRILRASLQYFCSSSVSREPSSTMLNCSGIRLWAIGTGYTLRGGNSTADTSKVRGAGPSAVFRSAAGAGLIRGDHEAPETRLVVERLEHRDGDHGGAVGVGHDPLGDGA